MLQCLYIHTIFSIVTVIANHYLKYTIFKLGRVIYDNAAQYKEENEVTLL